MPSIVRKPRASTASGGNPASLTRRREDVEHLSRNSDSPGKKQSAIAASLDGLNGGNRIAQNDGAPRKRMADQLGEDTAQYDNNASAKKPSAESSAADALAVRPRRRSKGCPLMVTARHKAKVLHNFATGPLHTEIEVTVSNRLVETEVDFEFGLEQQPNFEFIGAESFKWTLGGGEELVVPLTVEMSSSGVYNLQSLRLTVKREDVEIPYYFPLVFGPCADDTSRPRKKKKTQPAPVPADDWCVQRIVRDLGRLDVLRRGDVGPDVVSDDEDEKALDILVRKLAEDAEADEHMPPADDDDYDYGNIGGGGDAGDYGDAAMGFDDGHLDEEFIPAAPEHHYGEDGNSTAVITHDDDYNGDDMAIMADASNTGKAKVIDRASATNDEGYSEETAKNSSSEVIANIQVPTCTTAATSAHVELPPTDVNYNHGARNPLNNPTSKSVYQPGDDEALGRLKGLVRRQIEWFAASSKDVADRNAAPRQKNHHIVLGQVGFRCVHCAHTPFNARAKYAVNYPGSFSPNGLKSAIDRYNNRHFMECKEIPSNIKSHSKSLLTRQGKGGKDYVKYLSIRCKSIGIIEKDGRLVYDKDSISVVDERRDVIGSDGTEEGYWLCDKCQSVKFANFDEACRHEEACRSTAGKPAFGGIDQSDAYALSLCCECNEFEEPSSDVPMLLCDRCNSATHLTCTKDVPKLTEVPDGEWYCSTCVIANKRLSEDRAITTAFTAVGAALEDNFCPTDKRRRGPAPRLGQECFFRSIPGIQSKFYLTVPSNKRVRLCVVMGCSRAARGTQRRYMCKNHFSRALLLEKIQTMPNGERRFPCKSRRQSLPQEHETAYIAVPPNAKHGAKLSCSNAVCRSLFDKKCTHKYCAVCDNVFGKHIFRDLHKHEDELGPENQKKQTQVNTSHQAADVVGAEDSEVVYGFDSIRGHTKDKKRKGEYLFRVKWKNGEITSEPDTYLREDDPDTFVEYLKRSGLSKTKKYAWANEEEDV